jgi:hypothetical protein
MKYKSEVADIFWKFKAWVEKQSTHKMQVVNQTMEQNIHQKNSTSSVKRKALNIS